MKKIKMLLLLLLSVGFISVRAEDFNFLGKNLCEGIDYKTWRKYGDGTMKVVEDASKSGKGVCLKDVPSGKSVVVVSPFVPVESGYYFISLNYKSKGFGKKGYSGVGSYPLVLWYNSKKQQLKSAEAMWRFEYFDMDSGLVDAILHSPPQAAFMTIRVIMGNNSPVKKDGQVMDPQVTFDNVQIRKYTPLESAKGNNPVKTYYPYDKPFRVLPEGKAVEDKEAEKGRALAMSASGKKVLASHGLYEKNWKKGLYRLQARVKRGKGDGKGVLGYVDVLSEKNGARTIMYIDTDNVKDADKYVIVERDFVVHTPGFNVLRIKNYGILPWSVDWIKVIPLETMTEEQLKAMYPKSE